MTLALINSFPTLNKSQKPSGPQCKGGLTLGTRTIPDLILLNLQGILKLDCPSPSNHFNSSFQANKDFECIRAGKLVLSHFRNLKFILARNLL